MAKKKKRSQKVLYQDLTEGDWIVIMKDAEPRKHRKDFPVIRVKEDGTKWFISHGKRENIPADESWYNRYFIKKKEGLL